jgi:NADP-dependent 3-hydroxy acid dehydrogenase YdfG
MYRRTAIVTGASTGIGAACVRRLVRSGAHVTGVARRGGQLDRIASELVRFEGQFFPLPLDVTRPGAAEKVIEAARAAAGAEPDIFVVNAGRGLKGTLLGSDVALWSEMFELNCLSALLQMRAAAMHMRAMGSERVRDIVVVGSVVGRNVSPVNPVYGASKFALHSAAEALRQEVAGDRIRVTLIEPGVVRTDFQLTAKYEMRGFDANEEKYGPYLSADDIATLVAFALDQPEHVSISNLIVRPTRQTTP